VRKKSDVEQGNKLMLMRLTPVATLALNAVLLASQWQLPLLTS